jgi:hypothetical protein
MDRDAPLVIGYDAADEVADGLHEARELAVCDSGVSEDEGRPPGPFGAAAREPLQ